MSSIDITLDRPISQFVERQSRERKIPPTDTVSELVALGFETYHQKLYEQYRRGEMSFGRLARELGVISWEPSHLLEERGWAAYNLPSS